MHTRTFPTLRRTAAGVLLTTLGITAALAADSSKWSTDGLKVMLSVNGGAPAPFFARGVCYGVAPIGDLGNQASPYQDFFYYRGDPNGIGTKGYTPIWTRDIGTTAKPGYLRKLGVNSLRTYSMYKHGYTDPSKGYRDNYEFWNTLNWSTAAPPSSDWWVHDGHDKFLDMCWNGGKDPIYVWIGVPFAELPFGYAATPEERKKKEDAYQFFLKTCEWLAKKYGNHPAVMGFILGNEHDAEAGVNVAKIRQENNNNVPLPPPADWGPDYLLGIDGKPLVSLGGGKYQGMPAGNYWRTDYWDKLNAMYDVIKKNAPDKLITIALHDKPRAAGHWLAKADDISKTITLIDQPVWDYGKMDVLSLNIYRDPKDALGEYTTTYLKWLKDTGRDAKVKPILFTEMGVPASTRDGNKAVELPDNGKAASDILVRQWQQMFANRSDGGTGPYPDVAGGYIFSYLDEWFKAGNPQVHDGNDAYMDQAPGKHWDEEWFGLFSVSASPTRGFSQDVTQSKRQQPTTDAPERRPPVNEWTGDLNGGPDVLKPRAAYTALQTLFKENAAPPQSPAPVNGVRTTAPTNGKTQGAGDFLSN